MCFEYDPFQKGIYLQGISISIAGTGTSWSSPVHLFVEHLGLSFSGAVNFQWESSGGRLLRIAGVVSKNSAVNALSSPSQIRRVGSSRGAKNNHHLKANLLAGFIGYRST